MLPPSQSIQHEQDDYYEDLEENDDDNTNNNNNNNNIVPQFVTNFLQALSPNRRNNEEEADVGEDDDDDYDNDDDYEDDVDVDVDEQADRSSSSFSSSSSSSVSSVSSTSSSIDFNRPRRAVVTEELRCGIPSPVCYLRNYRSTLVGTLASLRVLDNTVVSAAEKASAQRHVAYMQLNAQKENCRGMADVWLPMLLRDRECGLRTSWKNTSTTAPINHFSHPPIT